MGKAQSGTAMEPLGAGELRARMATESLSDTEASEKKT
eukprot:CAMPEP_0177181244 /NCGR_PEP_ID=MMETSP0367-20130122/15818_1 /TAXON_ID=447022 ORGANISM="Scrippsiella hangoei-like, Strain SHHI-4" /NCGR_SAMPLE_ID=MMETSP0367 /ASSEMBLY_ACC=CAM_ASM_000362 /LENGTH=37 /DNA_ID= /DNA_START= /DNA_END= /DNA_ORIENTATION=